MGQDGEGAHGHRFRGVPGDKEVDFGRNGVFWEALGERVVLNSGVIALPYGEAAYYGLVKGGSIGLGIVGMLDDMGFLWSQAYVVNRC